MVASQKDAGRQGIMLRFVALLIYCLDRLFPRPRVEGRESDQAYSEWEYRVGKELLDRYSDHLGSIAGKSVLDIGCGFGGKTCVYAAAGADVIGVDIVREKIVQSADFVQSRGSDATFTVGDAERLPFPDGTFDLVVANDSMEHFPDPEIALTELVRVLRPGGKIFLSFTPWRSPFGSHLYDYIRTPWCHLLFTERLLKEILRVVVSRRGEQNPEQAAGRLMEKYHVQLNRITVFRYRCIVSGIHSLETVLEKLVPPKYTFLSPLTRLPVLGEFFTGTVVGVLRKKGGAGDL
jgi:ubiquinone/menaquinone biosynthesis C-methylase UbiE